MPKVLITAHQRGSLALLSPTLMYTEQSTLFIASYMSVNVDPAQVSSSAGNDLYARQGTFVHVEMAWVGK